MNLLWHIEVVIIILIIIGLTERQICPGACSLSQQIAIELFFEIIKSLIYEISGLTVFLFLGVQLRYLLLPYSI
jgi:hypothetical protein